MNLQDSIRTLLPRAREVTEGLSAAEMNWQSSPDVWSIAECVAHLNTTNEQYAGVIETSIHDGRERKWTSNAPLPELTFFEKWFVRSLEPPYKMKFKAPASFRPPSKTFDRDELLAKWTSTHERLAHLLADASGLDFKRIRVPSPATSLLKGSLVWAFRVVDAHDRRHLWQAERIRTRLLSNSRATKAGGSGFPE